MNCVAVTRLRNICAENLLADAGILEPLARDANIELAFQLGGTDVERDLGLVLRGGKMVAEQIEPVATLDLTGRYRHGVSDQLNRRVMNPPEIRKLSKLGAAALFNELHAPTVPLEDADKLEGNEVVLKGPFGHNAAETEIVDARTIPPRPPSWLAQEVIVPSKWPVTPVLKGRCASSSRRVVGDSLFFETRVLSIIKEDGDALLLPTGRAFYLPNKSCHYMIENGDEILDYLGRELDILIQGLKQFAGRAPFYVGLDFAFGTTASSDANRPYLVEVDTLPSLNYRFEPRSGEPDTAPTHAESMRLNSERWRLILEGLASITNSTSTRRSYASRN